MSVNEIPASGACDKLNEVQHTCEGEGKTMPTSIVKVISLS